jgi:two-component system sensor histidine kinase UhpB
MNLRRRLQRGTLIVALLTFVPLVVVLALWTVHDTRREIEATRQLVRTTASVVLQAQASSAERADPGSALADRIPPDARAPLRHVHIAVGSSTANVHPPSGGFGWTDRLFESGVEFIAVGKPGIDGIRPGLRIDANPRSELLEHLATAGIVFAAIAFFGALLAVFQYRTLLGAFSPVAVFAARLHAFEAGQFGTRLPPPEIEELAPIAEAFNRLADTLQHTLAEQARLSRSLLALRSEERRMLARELHDDLGQTVSALSVNAALLRQSIAADHPLAEGLDRLQADVTTLQVATRSMLAGLREDSATPWPRLDPQDIVQRWRDDRPDVEWTLDSNWAESLHALRLPEFTAACRILQEALVNAFRHASPSRLAVHVRHAAQASEGTDGPEGIELEILNDGVIGPGQPGTGLGLEGMAERAAALGAVLDCGPSGERSWRVRIRFAGSRPTDKGWSSP